MEKEKLKDRVFRYLEMTGKNIKEILWEDRNFVFLFVFFTFLYLSACFLSGVFIFIVLNIAMLLTLNFTEILNKNNISGKPKKILYLYVLVPCYSLIFIAGRKNSVDLLLWLFLLILFIKISIYLFQNILEDIITTKKSVSNGIFGLVGSILVGTLIGMISSMFLKQNFLTFTAINIFLAILVNVQEILGDKIKLFLEEKTNDNYLKISVYNYNNLVLTVTFVAILIFVHIIRI
ncbi:MAG: hypothetical protein LBS34_01780 [Rickettsiales bacterium]|jgi:hypothetical protein|nr:hypothetical protein [Rickettsiales bacterium]